MTYWDKPQKTTLSMRLTADEKRAIQDAAAAAGETVSDYIRLCCQVIPSGYIVIIRVPETGEVLHRIYPPTAHYEPGDRIKFISDDLNYECSGIVETVSPIWETAETLRLRYETLTVD